MRLTTVFPSEHMMRTCSGSRSSNVNERTFDTCTPKPLQPTPSRITGDSNLCACISLHTRTDWRANAPQQLQNTRVNTQCQSHTHTQTRTCRLKNTRQMRHAPVNARAGDTERDAQVNARPARVFLSAVRACAVSRNLQYLLDPPGNAKASLTICTRHAKIYTHTTH